MSRESAKSRIRQFFLDHIGEVVTSQQLQKAAAPATEFARRVRELRTDEGWPIVTHHDDISLKQNEYKLVSTPPSPDSEGYRFSSLISSRLRAQVLERNGYTCQMCGAGAGEVDEFTGRKVRLHIGHVVDRSHGGEDTLSNLKAICSTCNQGAKNLTQEPPSQSWLLGQLRRARVDDQKAAWEWLNKKFRINVESEST